MALAYWYGEHKHFDFGIWIMFAVGLVATYGNIAPLVGLYRLYSAAILFVTLGLTALVPPALGLESFTYYFARRQLPAWQLKTAEFRAVSRVMTLYWALIFFASAASVRLRPARLALHDALSQSARLRPRHLGAVVAPGALLQALSAGGAAGDRAASHGHADDVQREVGGRGAGDDPVPRQRRRARRLLAPDRRREGARASRASPTGQTSPCIRRTRSGCRSRTGSSTEPTPWPTASTAWKGTTRCSARCASGSLRRAEGLDAAHAATTDADEHPRDGGHRALSLGRGRPAHPSRRRQRVRRGDRGDARGGRGQPAHAYVRRRAVGARLHRAAERAVFAVNGNTVAPRAATIEWFGAHAIALIPLAGVLAAGPPAAPHALLTTLARFGTRSFAEVVAPALELAEDGFPLHPALRGPAPAHPLGDFSLAGCAELFRTSWPTSAAIYLPQGRLAGRRRADPQPRSRAHLSPPDRGRGPRQAPRAQRRHRRGDRRLLSRRDRRDHRRARGGARRASRARGPARLPERDRGDGVARLPGLQRSQVRPVEPGAGVPATARAPRRLRSQALGHGSADYVHVLVEAAKLAFADREQYYGDPGLRRRAARGAAVGDLRRRPSCPDRSAAGLARAASGRSAPRRGAARGAARSSRRATGAAAPSTSPPSTASATWRRSRRAAPGSRPRP